MTDYSKQIQRIKTKIPEAKRADRRCKVFGASSHKYEISKPVTQYEVSAFEMKYSIELPACYKAFVLQIGNGGIGYNGSAAGPFYGIYPFGTRVNELIYDNTEKYLKNDSVIYPGMTDDYWKELVKNIEENDLSDDDFEEAMGVIYGGVLPFGSQGCSYLHGIILNGQYKGRVVNLDVDRQKPHVAFEANFLDWYERWLDEIVSGELLKDGPSWFGYSKGGSEEELLDSYIASDDKKSREDCLAGLLDKNALKEETLKRVENLIENSAEHKLPLIKLLCKSSYEKAKPYLLELIKDDLLSVFQFVFWYAKNNSNEWLSIITENVSRINDKETFRFCTYLLEESKINYGDIVIPFTKSEDEEIRSQAFYSLGKLPDKKQYIEIFIEGLKDNNNKVLLYVLQALSNVKDDRLLKYYREIAERFPEEQDYILSNLNYRLAEYGLTNRTVFQIY